MAARKRLDDSLVMEYYKTQWEDIHHSRQQDWELSKLVLAGFLGVSGLRAFTEAPMLLLILSGSFVLLSILAVFITIRHKILFTEKLNVVRRLEKEMGIDKLELFKPVKGYLLFFSTQNFLIVIYSLAAVIFGAFFILQLTS